MLPGTRVRKTLQTRSAFALAEMILSVTVLAALAGFSLIMFISAKNNNTKSYDLYKAMSHATSVIETIKGVSHPDLLSEAHFQPETAVLSSNGQGATLSIYFDQDWAPLPPDSHQTKVCYSLQAELTPWDMSPCTQTGFQTYSIRVRVLRLMPYALEKDEAQEIISIETLKCYCPHHTCTKGAIR